ncbi:MAG: hypothetical protein U0263_31040 [Polyangiaceae bacterium]
MLPRPSRMTPALIEVSAALLLALLITATALFSRRAPVASELGARSVVGDLAPATSVASPPPRMLSSAPAAAPPDPSAQPSPIASSSRPPLRIAKPPGDCNPPYTLDPDGVKVPKRHCYR